MRISSISVSNFKSYDKATIDFKSLNLLIGANASGKSNTINIFRFIDYIIDYGIQNAVSLLGGIEYVLNTSIGKKRPLSLNFTLDCEDEDWIRHLGDKDSIYLKLIGFSYEFELKPYKRGTGFSIQKDELILRYCQANKEENNDKYALDKDKKYWIKYKRKNKKIIADVVNETDFKDNEDLKNGINSEFLTYYLSDKEDTDELLLHFIHLFMPPMFYSKDIVRIYDFDPKLMKKSTSLTSKRYLEEDGSNLANILQGILKSTVERKRLENLMKDCLPFVDTISTENNFDKSITYKIKEHYSNKPLYANFLSDGTVSVLAMIIALHFEKDAGTIIIEEPERNLHPHLMSRIIEMAQVEAENRQIIITTHTPELIKHADIESILLAQRCEDGYTCITQPANDETVKNFIEHEVGIESLFVQNLLGGC